MAYIGHQAADRFVSQPAVDQFSGDGSTTAFTLSFPVSSDQDILVSVDGVIQDTAAYAVSSGTTLTFTAAPSSNSGNNIFVNYLARTSATVAHPSTSGLAATTGAFSDAVSMASTLTVTDDANFDSGTLFVDASTDRVGMGTSSPQVALHVEAASASGKLRLSKGTVSSADDGIGTIQFRTGNTTAAANINGRTDASSSGNGALQFQTGTTSSVSEAMRITSSGEITKPLQPAFNVHPASEQSNVAINQNVTVVFGTERFDVGSNFSSNTFTAPVTGKYLLTTNLYLDDFDASADYFQTEIHTSNYTYKVISESSSNDHDTYNFSSLSVVADMDANDTAIVRVFQGSGAAQVDMEIGSSFPGALIC